MSEACPEQHDEGHSPSHLDPRKLFLDGRVRLYFRRALRLRYRRASSSCQRLTCCLQKGLLLLMVLSLKMLMVCVVCVAGASGTLGRCFRKCVCAVRRAVSMESEKSGPSGDYNHIEGALVCVCVCACACVGVEV